MREWIERVARVSGERVARERVLREWLERVVRE